MKDRFDEAMEANRPTQTAGAREVMFAHVSAQVSGANTKSLPIKSPYTPRVVASVLGVCFIIATGGTVAAAEKAKPGDVLFPVDQATEAMRLLLANNEQKTALQSQFLDERQRELAAIVAEEIEKTKKEITDITNGVQVNEQGEARITRAVDEFLRQAEQLPKSDTEGRRQAVVALINEVRVHGREGDDVRLRIDGDRFEIRTDDIRVRSRNDGELEVRMEHDDDGGGDDDSDRSSHGSDDDRQFDYSDARGVESDDSFDDYEEDDSYDDSGRDDVKDVSDSGDEHDDSDNRLEDHSGKDEDKDENKDEDRDEDKKDDNSGKSDDN
jgi:hypothetical protein